MTRYVGIMEQGEKEWGMYFPQLPGCVAMGASRDEAFDNAVLALAEYLDHEIVRGRPHRPYDLDEVCQDADVLAALAEGAMPIFVPYVRDFGRSERVNISIDAGLLRAIDETSRKRGVTRSSFMAAAARKAIENEA